RSPGSCCNASLSMPEVASDGLSGMAFLSFWPLSRPEVCHIKAQRRTSHRSKGKGLCVRQRDVQHAPDADEGKAGEVGESCLSSEARSAEGEFFRRPPGRGRSGKSRAAGPHDAARWRTHSPFPANRTQNPKIRRLSHRSKRQGAGACHRDVQHAPDADEDARQLLRRGYPSLSIRFQTARFSSSEKNTQFATSITVRPHPRHTSSYSVEHTATHGESRSSGLYDESDIRPPS